jgi:phosphate:Na+ symporter
LIELAIGLASGLGIFLFGMRSLEKALQSLGGQKLREILSRSTRSPAGSVTLGAGVTALLQSSSMVSLIVLAFASAGVIPLFNAVGVILGANLGTTFTGWIVTSLGFKADLASLALPLFGIGALIKVFSRQRSKLNYSAGAVLGLGLILFGLELLKASVENLPSLFPENFLSDLPSLALLGFGIVITAIIQSSSAMTMIALTALNAGIIDLQGAAALVIGADIGTTSTTALGSLRGSAIVKRLALAHVTYNVVVDAIAYLVLLPMLPWVISSLQLNDPLYALVAFHSFFNLLGLFIFIPILKPFSHWLEGWFDADSKHVAKYLRETPPQIAEASVIALDRQLEDLGCKTLALAYQSLGFDLDDFSKDRKLEHIRNAFDEGEDYFRRYEQCKRIEGDIHRYGAKVRQFEKNNGYAKKVLRQENVARDFIYALKTFKDAYSDLEAIDQLMRSDVGLKKQLDKGFTVFFEVMAGELNAQEAIENIAQIKVRSEAVHESLYAHISSLADCEQGDDLGISTMFNANREIWHAQTILCESMMHWVRLHFED